MEERVERPSFTHHPIACYLRLGHGGIAFYFVFFACVLGAAQGRPFIGPLLVLASLTFHTVLSPQRRKDLLIILGVTLSGALIETIFIVSGVMNYATLNSSLPWVCPLWLASVYSLYAMTLDHSLAWLQKNMAAAAALGAGGAVASYLACEKIGVVEFLLPNYGSVIILALVWAVYCPLTCLFSRWLNRFFPNA